MPLSRRNLLAGAATTFIACCADGVGEARADPLALTFFVTPQGAGSGVSWENAASISGIGNLIAHTRPGGEILIAADRGDYNIVDEMGVYAGGVEGVPIRIRGVNSATGAPMPAIIRANRSGTEIGREGFRLLDNANHLHFSFLDFRDIGNGCLRIAGSIVDITIEDCAFDNVYRFLENTATGGAGSASLREFAVRRVSGTRAERGFLRLRYDCSDGVIEDCSAHGLANEGGVIPAGCALEDRASRITYRRCTMVGFQQWHAPHYWNGDGFSDEAQNQNIRYEACQARGQTDGGFDCKSQNVTLVNCISEDNKRNYRIWSANAALTGCTSRSPKFRGQGQESADSCHIWIGGPNASVIRITELTVEDRDAQSMFDFEDLRARVELTGLTRHTPRENWGDGRIRHVVGATTIVTPGPAPE